MMNSKRVNRVRNITLMLPQLITRANKKDPSKRRNLKNISPQQKGNIKTICQPNFNLKAKLKGYKKSQNTTTAGDRRVNNRINILTPSFQRNRFFSPQSTEAGYKAPKGLRGKVLSISKLSKNSWFGTKRVNCITSSKATSNIQQVNNLALNHNSDVCSPLGGVVPTRQVFSPQGVRPLVLSNQSSPRNENWSTSVLRRTNEHKFSTVPQTKGYVAFRARRRSKFTHHCKQTVYKLRLRVLLITDKS